MVVYKSGGITMKTLIVYVSVHHNNTEKVAVAIGEILDADIMTPQQVDETCIAEYDMIGVGSGIYHAAMHEELLDFVEELPLVSKNAFIFSTRGIGPSRVYHRSIRKRLERKGFTIVGEFSCKGLDTYGFLKYIGGINKGRPNEKDLEKAREFARQIKGF